MVMIVFLSFVTLASAEDKKESEKKVEKPYSLDYCIVSGEKLGTMGDAVKYDYKGREIQFCCKMCLKTFEKDPETYLKKIYDAVLDKQIKEYPLDTCVVSDEKLGGMGEAVNFQHEGRLVRFCCNGCKKDFQKDPEKFLKKIDEAAAKKKDDKKDANKDEKKAEKEHCDHE